MKTQRRFFLILAVAVALLTGLCALLLREEHIPFFGFVLVAVGLPSIMGYLGPQRLWRYAVVASLGLPVIYLLSNFYGTATGTPFHHMDNIFLVVSLLVGALCAFGGVVLGLGIRKLRTKEPVSAEWSPSASLRRATTYTLVATGIAIPAVLVFLTDPYEPLMNGVKLGDGQMKKTLFASDPQIGYVSCIKLLDGGTDSAGFMIVAGSNGAMRVAQDGKTTATVSFSHLLGERVRMGRVEPMDTDGDGIYEYLDTGGGWGPVSLISNTGSSLWQYEGEGMTGAPNAMTPIDMDGDGAMEFVVGLNGGAGIKAFDRHGKELWSHPASNVFSVAAVDVDQDGAREILHSDGDALVIRSPHGDIIRTLQIPLYGFAVCGWTGRENVILEMDDSGLKAYDFEGNPVDSLTLPITGRDVYAVTAQFGGETFFAVVVAMLASSHQSMLYLFDSRDTLVYHEVFAGLEPAIAVLPGHDELGDALLVGGADGEVMMYRYEGVRSRESNQ